MVGVTGKASIVGMRFRCCWYTKTLCCAKDKEFQICILINNMLLMK